LGDVAQLVREDAATQAARVEQVDAVAERQARGVRAEEAQADAGAPEQRLGRCGGGPHPRHAHALPLRYADRSRQADVWSFERGARALHELALLLGPVARGREQRLQLPCGLAPAVVVGHLLGRSPSMNVTTLSCRPCQETTFATWPSSRTGSSPGR